MSVQKLERISSDPKCEDGTQKKGTSTGILYGMDGLPSTRYAFWFGAARIFDLFGLIDKTGRPLDGPAGRQADLESLDNYRRMTLGDLSKAWEITESEMRASVKNPADLPSPEQGDSSLPTPGVLREYESRFPGATKRLFGHHEKQSDHRMQVEREMLPTVCKRYLQGQWMAFTFALSAMILSGVLAILGNVVGAGLVAVLVIVPVAGLPGFLITGRRGRRQIRAAHYALNLSDRSST